MSFPELFSNPFIVGGWQLDSRSWKALSESEVAHALDLYLAHGVTAFDTADIYGQSEQLLGKLLKGRDCTILTKAVFFGSLPTPTHVRHKIEASLRNLQREALDCVQLHWHNPKLDMTPTLETFAQFVQQGKIRYLGVTNFNCAMLKQALQVAPITSHQVQYSLVDRRVENGMQALCKENGISLLPYGPLAGGFLSNKFLNVKTPSIEADHARSFYYSSMIEAHGGWNAVLEMLTTLSAIAKTYEKTIAQVALNWVKQQPGVTAVISGLTLNRQQILHNANALTWQLAPEDVKTLSERSQALFQQRGDIYSYERG
jgi:aryl-alcohol dehydrogenase-like predicted oxidoreductase